MTNSKAYFPIHALRTIDLESILSIALPQRYNKRKYDHHNSRQTLLYYLLSTPEQDRSKLNDLLGRNTSAINWEKAEKDYSDLKKITEQYKVEKRVDNEEKYWEFKTKPIQSGPQQSFNYISRFRKKGFLPDELKIYWNYDEIKGLKETDKFNPNSDKNTHKALNDYPVNKRQNNVQIKFVYSGIEKAVFDVPNNKQIIVLDFADERMPGGYFLENARTQEEVILYNSDGYQALLDLKYQIMDGGYMLPEFGVAYVKNVRFFQKDSIEPRLTDLIVAACYDLSGMGEGLYKPPSRELKNDLEKQTLEKFRSIIASAVANSDGNGENTYLLLGPIGTGAFSNDMKMIARLFAQVLNEHLMDSEKAIKYAFEQIWFVSIDSLTTFQAEFEKYDKKEPISLETNEISKI